MQRHERFLFIASLLLIVAVLNGVKGAYQACVGGGAPIFYFFVAACCASCAVACLLQSRRMER